MDAVTEAITERLPNQSLDRWKPKGCQRIALVLQGGGALGACQAGEGTGLVVHDVHREDEFR